MRRETIMRKMLQTNFINVLGHGWNERHLHNGVELCLCLAGLWQMVRLWFIAGWVSIPLGTPAHPQLVKISTQLATDTAQFWGALFNIPIMTGFITLLAVTSCLAFGFKRSGLRLACIFIWLLWWTYTGGILCLHSTDHSAGGLFLVYAGLSLLVGVSLAVMLDQERPIKALTWLENRLAFRTARTLANIACQTEGVVG